MCNEALARGAIEFEGSEFNFEINSDGETGVLASGIGYNYATDSIKKLGINASIMKLGTTYPLPRKKIAVFLKRHKTVIIVEELSPYLEHAVKKIAFDNDIDIEVIGKDTGHFIEAMEYNVPI